MADYKPKILILDIETSPLISYTWGIFDQNISLNQIKEDWHLLSFAAKYLGEKEVIYQDQRNEKDIRNDKPLLNTLWKLLDSADVVIGQNVEKFDIKKIKARMIIHGMRPTSDYQIIDTLKIAKKHFAMTSNKLEYLSGQLCTKKKSSHPKFSGFELWRECLKGNIAAWNEMEKYNKQDVLSTEELYLKLRPYENSYNPNVFSDDLAITCACGNKRLQKNGFKFTKNAKCQRYLCTSCGSIFTGKKNLLSKEKRGSLLK